MSKRNSSSTKRARALRQNETDAEAKMWSILRNRNLHNFKFVREHPIGSYFADFACRRKKLIVEIDGSQHADRKSDDQRDVFINRQGYGVVRFWNNDVLRDTETVLNIIVGILESRIWQREDNNEWRYWPATKEHS